MGSGDAFELAWQMVLSPLKLVFIILVMFLSVLIIYGISRHILPINLDRIELNEVNNIIINCLSKNSMVKEDTFNEAYLNSCINSMRYGIKLKFKDKSITLNDDTYSLYKGVCNKLSICSSLEYRDLNGDRLSIEIVKKNE